MTTYSIEQQIPDSALVASSTITGRTIARAFKVTSNVTIHAIWYRSPQQSGALPTSVAVFQATTASAPSSGGSLVSGTSAPPTWSGAAGTGWVSTQMGDTVTLVPGNTYYVAVFYAGDGTNKWWASATDGAPSILFTGGVLWGGEVTNGPIVGLSSTDVGTNQQDTTNASATGIAYPNHSIGGAVDLGVDIEVTPVGGGTVNGVGAAHFGISAAASGTYSPPVGPVDGTAHAGFGLVAHATGQAVVPSTGHTPADTYVDIASSSLLALLNTVSLSLGGLGPESESLQVVDGMAVEYLSNYSVTLDGWTDWEQSWWTLGGMDRIEHFSLNLTVHVWQGNSDPASRRQEALSIVYAIRAALSAELALVQSGNGSFLGLPPAADVGITTGDPTQGPAAGSSGWGIDLAITIECNNITLIS